MRGYENLWLFYSELLIALATATAQTQTQIDERDQRNLFIFVFTFTLHLFVLRKFCTPLINLTCVCVSRKGREPADVNIFHGTHTRIRNTEYQWISN